MTGIVVARAGSRQGSVGRVSTHIVQPLAAAALERWGLLEALIATGCPPIHTYAFDFGPFTLSGSPGLTSASVAFCPRRIILDKLLVDAAAEAGAEVREGFKVEDVLVDDGRVVGISGRSQGGDVVTERAGVVIGADGLHSRVSEAVRPERYHERPPLLAAYYSYWSGLPVDGCFENHIRHHRGFAAAPTHDGLTLVVGGWPQSEFAANKQDVEGHFSKMVELVPAFAERMSDARREVRFAGASLPNYFHKPYGPGWVLVGDAGYLKDPITAQGINDAFRDAEHCAAALDQVFTNARSFDDVMGEYQRERDEHALPMYEFTCQLATMEPPPAEMQQLFGAISRSQTSMDGFVQMNAGTIAPARFFSPESIGRIMAAAQSAN